MSAGVVLRRGGGRRLLVLVLAVGATALLAGSCGQESAAPGPAGSPSSAGAEPATYVLPPMDVADVWVKATYGTPDVPGPVAGLDGAPGVAFAADPGTYRVGWRDPSGRDLDLIVHDVAAVGRLGPVAVIEAGGEDPAPEPVVFAGFEGTGWPRQAVDAGVGPLDDPWLTCLGAVFAGPETPPRSTDRVVPTGPVGVVGFVGGDRHVSLAPYRADDGVEDCAFAAEVVSSRHAWLAGLRLVTQDEWRAFMEAHRSGAPPARPAGTAPTPSISG